MFENGDVTMKKLLGVILAMVLLSTTAYAGPHHHGHHHGGGGLELLVAAAVIGVTAIVTAVAAPKQPEPVGQVIYVEGQPVYVPAQSVIVQSTTQIPVSNTRTTTEYFFKNGVRFVRITEVKTYHLSNGETREEKTIREMPAHHIRY